MNDYTNQNSAITSQSQLKFYEQIVLEDMQLTIKKVLLRIFCDKEPGTNSGNLVIQFSFRVSCTQIALPVPKFHFSVTNDG